MRSATQGRTRKHAESIEKKRLSKEYFFVKEKRKAKQHIVREKEQI